MFIENMDEKAHYTTYQTHQMNTLIVYKNCAMNLYGIKRRTRLIKKQKQQQKVHKSVQEGSLGLPHLKTFISALKLTWIHKF